MSPGFLHRTSCLLAKTLTVDVSSSGIQYSPLASGHCDSTVNTNTCIGSIGEDAVVFVLTSGPFLALFLGRMGGGGAVLDGPVYGMGKKDPGNWQGGQVWRSCNYMGDAGSMLMHIIFRLH